MVLGAEPMLDRWQEIDLMATDAYDLAATVRVPIGGSNDSSSGRVAALFDEGLMPALGGLFPSTTALVQHLEGDDSNALFLGLDHAAVLHHDVLDDAFKLLQARRSIHDELLAGGSAANINMANMGDFYAWLRILTWTAPGQYGSGDRNRKGSISSTSSGNSDTSRASGTVPGTSLFQITDPAADLAYLPLETTRLNTDSSQICMSPPCLHY